MKRGVVGSGSAANPNYPDTAAANAGLEARLTGSNTGGSGSSTPNEAQVRVLAERSHCSPASADWHAHAHACLQTQVYSGLHVSKVFEPHFECCHAAREHRVCVNHCLPMI